MKNIYTLFALLLLASITTAQSLEKNLDSFDKLVISEFIDVELRQGSEEKIEFTFNQNETNANDLVSKIKGNTLHVYLEGYEMGPHIILNKEQRNWNRKPMPKVTAVITYNKLSKIKMYGEETLVCDNEISSKKIKLKLYGEINVKIASIKANRLKIALYGDNRLKIGGGEAQNQRINSYGDNTVLAQKFGGSHLKSTSLGEGQMHFGLHDHIRVISLGETQMTYAGNPRVNKPLVLGESDIRSRR